MGVLDQGVLPVFLLVRRWVQIRHVHESRALPGDMSLIVSMFILNLGMLTPFIVLFVGRFRQVSLLHETRTLPGNVAFVVSPLIFDLGMLLIFLLVRRWV